MVTPSFMESAVALRSAVWPVAEMRRTGVRKIPAKLPTVELMILRAVLPPATLVTMTAEDTGGGRQPRTNSPIENIIGVIDF